MCSRCVIFLFFILSPFHISVAQQSSNQISGKVVDVSGESVAEVNVVIFTAGMSAYIRNGIDELNHRGNKGMKTETDTSGNWQLDDPKSPYGLFFYHEKGYAIFETLPYENESTVQLIPWGKIKGKLSVMGGGYANESISLNVLNRTGGMNKVHFDYQTKTNENGEFVIENVIENEYQVSHMVPQNPGQTSGTSHVVSHKIITVKSGEEVFVPLWSFQSSQPYNINSSFIIFITGIVISILLILIMKRYVHQSID